MTRRELLRSAGNGFGMLGLASLLAGKSEAAGALGYERRGDSLEISVRPFVFWDGPQPARRFTAVFDNQQIFSLKDEEGKEVSLARLEPLPIC